MPCVSIDEWMREISSLPGSGAVGMMLAHRGVVRATSRGGEAVCGMTLTVDHRLLERVLDEARARPGIFAVRGWVNEGELSVGDDIMKLVVAGDVRERVFAALENLVSRIKTQVVVESELLVEPE